MTATRIQKKICMLGIFGVGKTSMVRRFVFEKFDDSYLSTIGVKVNQKILPPQENSEHKMIQHNLLIWDIEGFDDKTKPLNNYFIGSAGALVVADLTRMESITSLPTIFETFQAVAPEAKLVLVGNKMDLVDKEAPTLVELTQFAAEGDIAFLPTSAKTGENVEAAFQKLGLLLAD